jgi:hypothetical protein
MQSLDSKAGLILVAAGVIVALATACRDPDGQALATSTAVIGLATWAAPGSRPAAGPGCPAPRAPSHPACSSPHSSRRLRVVRLSITGLLTDGDRCAPARPGDLGDANRGDLVELAAAAREAHDWVPLAGRLVRLRAWGVPVAALSVVLGVAVARLRAEADDVG